MAALEDKSWSMVSHDTQIPSQWIYMGTAMQTLSKDTWTLLVLLTTTEVHKSLQGRCKKSKKCFSKKNWSALIEQSFYTYSYLNVNYKIFNDKGIPCSSFHITSHSIKRQTPTRFHFRKNKTPQIWGEVVNSIPANVTLLISNNSVLNPLPAAVTTC